VKSSLGPHAPPTHEYSIESPWFHSRLTERRTPLGGPIYSFNGWPAEQIKTFFREHCVEPPISDELFHSICLKIIQDYVNTKGKTLRHWETLVWSLFESGFKGAGKCRRASGHGYAGGDGYVDIDT